MDFLGIFERVIKEATLGNRSYDWNTFTLDELFQAEDLLEDNPEQFKKQYIPKDGKPYSNIELPEVRLELERAEDKYLESESGDLVHDLTDEEIEAELKNKEIGEPVPGGIRKGLEAGHWDWYVYDLEELEEIKREALLNPDKFKVEYGVEGAPLNDLEYGVAVNELNKTIEEYGAWVTERKQIIFAKKIIERRNK